jgi:hypothetical protein
MGNQMEEGREKMEVSGDKSRRARRREEADEAKIACEQAPVEASG